MANVEEFLRKRTINISIEEYNRQAEELTALELEHLQNVLKHDNSKIDDTLHFKKDFFSPFFLKGIKFHKQSFQESFMREMIPSFEFSKRSLTRWIYQILLFYYLLASLYYYQFSKFASTALLFLIFVLLYAVQKSLYIKSHKTELEWKKKLSTSTCFFWENEKLFQINAFVVATAIRKGKFLNIKNFEENENFEERENFFPDDLKDSQTSTENSNSEEDIENEDLDDNQKKSKKDRLYYASLFSIFLSLFHALIPFFFELFKRKTLILTENNYNLLIFQLLYFLIHWVLFGVICLEFILAAISFYNKREILFRFLYLTKKNFRSFVGLPPLKLSCEENIFAWAKIRKYLQDTKFLKIAYFQVILSFILVSVTSLSIILIYRVLFLVQNEIHLFDIYAAFYLFIFGIVYLLGMIFIGCEIDRILLLHLEFLSRIKWKLDKALTESNPPRRLPRSSQNLSFESPLFRESYKKTEPAILSTPKNLQDSFFPPFSVSPLNSTPIKNNNHSSLNNNNNNKNYLNLTKDFNHLDHSHIKELRYLIDDLQNFLSTKDRVNLLGFIKIDYSFLLKILSVIGAAVVSNIKTILQNS